MTAISIKKLIITLLLLASISFTAVLLFFTVKENHPETVTNKKHPHIKTSANPPTQTNFTP